MKSSICLIALLALTLTAFGKTPDYAAIAGYQRGESRAPLNAVIDLVKTTKAGSPQQKSLESGLANILTGESTYDGKLFACKMLWIIGSEASTDRIGSLLLDEKTADMACFALGTQPSDKAAGVLLKALPQASGRARLAIINLLGEHRYPQATKPLAALQPNPAALAALGKIATPEAIATLKASSKRAAADAALLQSAQELARRNQNRESLALYTHLLQNASQAFIQRGALLSLAELDPPGAAKQISGLLVQADHPLRAPVISLARILPKDLVDQTLIPAGKTFDAEDLAQLVENLAARPDRLYRSFITDLLGHKDSIVRQTAITALARIGDETSVPRLINTAKTFPQESSSAWSALRQLPGKAVNMALLTAMNAETGDTQVALIQVLSDRRANDAVSSLLPLASSENPKTARAALKALGLLGHGQDINPMIQSMLSMEHKTTRTEAERAIGAVIKRTRHTRSLTKAWEGASKDQNKASLIRIASLAPGEKTFPLIKSAVASSSADVKDAALRALTGWPEAEALPLLISELTSTANNTHRVLALRGAIRLIDATPDTATRIEPLQQLIPAIKTDADAKLVVGSLSKIPLPAAIDLVEQARRNGIMAEADQAIKRISSSLK